MGHMGYCYNGCPMRLVLPDDITNLQLVLDGSGVLSRFFTRVNALDRANVARALLWSANLWLLYPFRGPYAAYLDLVDRILSLPHVEDDEFVFDQNVAVPFQPLQPENVQDNRCLFHVRQGSACPPTCCFRIVFSSTCNQEAFDIIYHVYGGGNLIPRFFGGVEDCYNRMQIATALLWEADCWVNHPAGGPWLVIGNLVRELARRQDAAA